MDHRLTWTFTERPAAGRRVLYWMQASVRVRDNLGLALAALGRPAEAIPHYAEAVRLNPEVPGIYTLRGRRP